MTFDSVEIIEDEIINGKATIKIIGVGGGGCNAVNRMIESGLGDGVQFIAANTDRQALDRSRAATKIVLGTKLTHGLGAGGRPEVGEKAAIEDKEIINALLEGTDMVFITAGMGGGTGTGGAPVIAKLAKDMGILTVAVVTTPFRVEGKVKANYAAEGIKKLRENVDTLIVIPNENLFRRLDEKTTLPEAFRMADDTLRQSILGITNLITGTGIINLDFADVRTIMKDKGETVMGIGVGKGENRAEEAVNNAVSNKLLQDSSIDGASDILLNITSGPDLTTRETEKILDLVHARADENAHIIFGQREVESMSDSVEVTIIATGCKGKNHNVITPEPEAVAKPETVPEPEPEPELEPEPIPEPETQKSRPVYVPEPEPVQPRKQFAANREKDIDTPAIYRIGDRMREMRKGLR